MDEVELTGCVCSSPFPAVTWDWKYVGEAGEEIAPRNSHSLSVLSVPSPSGGEAHDSYLVLFGGGSPEMGPLGDTYWALLPAEGITGEDSHILLWCRDHWCSCLSPS